MLTRSKSTIDNCEKLCDFFSDSTQLNLSILILKKQPDLVYLLVVNQNQNGKQIDVLAEVGLRAKSIAVNCDHERHSKLHGEIKSQLSEMQKGLTK